MAFSNRALGEKRPDSIVKDVSLPRRQDYYPSPVDWRDEVLYFLLVDRFSDGQEGKRQPLDRKSLWTGRPKVGGESWSWELWAESGTSRWQGGTLRGVRSKLGYLKDLGITALWLSPVFKQRGHEGSYHGYGVQDFLEVDPRFGDRKDLVELVAAAHKEDLRIILDIIFNHSGCNWLYAEGTPGGIFEPYYTFGRYQFGSWRGSQGQAINAIETGQDGAWPVELQNKERYTRAGNGNLGAGEVNDPNAEHKRSDFRSLRDFNFEAPDLLNDLAKCYKYWIALTDCDGFRLDTLKHVSFEEARNFCGTIKEFAANLGKDDFFLVGEIAGGDYNTERYFEALDRNLNAALDIGEMRLALNGVAKGLAHPGSYFRGFSSNEVFGSHRNLGNQHVSVLDDHDHVFGEKIRFSAEAASENQVVAGVALQLFSLGIPCIYYGTEQALAGPEVLERKWLPEWKSSDRYLREAMFGPLHPHKDGLESLSGELDQDRPGFGPFGTAGQHCFDQKFHVYRRIAAMTALRQAYPVLRHGRQYLRQIALPERQLPGFDFYGFGWTGEGGMLDGQIVAWSRILDDEEVLCVLNSHGKEARSANVLVDASLNPPPGSIMSVVLNTAQEAAKPRRYAGTHPAGSKAEVQRTPEGMAYVEIKDLAPSEMLVLANHPEKEEGKVA